jgi:hypothetical protein
VVLYIYLMRVKLSEQYANEREEICKKIINILQLDADNSFLLSELDENNEKQQAIMKLKDEIPKYFAVSAITPFISGRECARPALSIIKGILKQQGYYVVGKTCSFKFDGGYEWTTKYHIFRKTDV